MARQERSAGFIIFYQPEAPSNVAEHAEPLFLLLDYGRHWDFPKGHLEKGEDDLTAAIRELREETGIQQFTRIPEFQHEIVYFFRHKRHGVVRKTVVFFLAHVPDQGVKLSNEHSGYEFLPYEQAVKRVTFPTAKQVLRAAGVHLHLVPAPIRQTPVKPPK